MKKSNNTKRFILVIIKKNIRKSCIISYTIQLYIRFNNLNMPKKKMDYSNTIIYKIFCKDPIIKEIYIGHTTNFVTRKSEHKTSCKNSNIYIYIYIVI
jgi:hypothetical protein